MQAPVFHYVVPCVHRGTQQVVPVVAVPRTVRLDFAAYEVCWIGAVDRHEPLKPLSKSRQHGCLPLHANDIHHELNVLLEQPVETLTFDTNCYIWVVLPDPAQAGYQAGNNALSP
jgi:hypothetical protein